MLKSQSKIRYRVVEDVVHHLPQEYERMNLKDEVWVGFSKSTFLCFQRTITQSIRHQMRHANTLDYTTKYEEQLTRRNREEKMSGTLPNSSSKLATLTNFMQKIESCLFSISFSLHLSLSRSCKNG